MRIVSGSDDGSEDESPQLWIAQHSGQPIGAPLSGHEDMVISVAFSADGTRFVSGSADGTLALWDAKVLESAPGLYALLCASLQRNLTREEWVLNVPADETCRKVCDHLPLEE